MGALRDWTRTYDSHGVIWRQYPNAALPLDYETLSTSAL